MSNFLVRQDPYILIFLEGGKRNSVMTKAIAIDDAIKSMRADAYYNKEVLPEMLSLQEEISELTFGEKGKRIYEVSHYLTSVF